MRSITLFVTERLSLGLYALFLSAIKSLKLTMQIMIRRLALRGCAMRTTKKPMRLFRAPIMAMNLNV